MTGTATVLTSCTSDVVPVQGIGERTASITVTPKSGDIVEVFLLEQDTLQPLVAHISKTVS